MTDKCPHCQRPVLSVARSLSTITWVHEVIGAYIFGCSRSLLQRKDGGK